MDTPTEERLLQMSYSELKRYAKSHGIKKTNKKKTKSLIASILERTRSAEDSFVTMEQKIINSCNKNKQEKFDKDKEVASDTPRRETFTIDSPLNVSLALNNELITSSASPALKISPAEHEKSLNVTMTRGSEKKGKKRKVSFVTPIRRSARLSVLTPHFASVRDRPKTPIPSRLSSARKRESPLTKEKKLFSGSLYITNTARKSSEGGKERRPSTPIPNPKPKRMKLSSTGLETPIASPDSTPGTSELQLSKQKKMVKSSPALETTTATPVSTPGTSVVLLSKQKQLLKDFLGSPIATPVSVPGRPIAPLSKQKQLLKATPVPTIKSALTPALLSSTKGKRSSPRNSAVKRMTPVTNPKSKNTFTPMARIKSAVTPSSVKVTSVTPKPLTKQSAPMKLSSAKAKKTATPNFSKLHEKQFAKMESIDEYVRRKQLHSSKKAEEHKIIRNAVKLGSSKKMAEKKNSRIPKKFHGIPFIPSITSTADMKTNFAFASSRPITTPGKRLPAIKFGSHNESLKSKKLIEGGAKSSRPVMKENTPLKKKVFNLKASLSQKLKYKPHTGPLKPLEPVNLNTSIFSGTGQPKTTSRQNKVLQAKRIEVRGALKGVRKNRRFELQMQNRKVAINK